MIASCLICNFPVIGIPQILILKFNEEDLQYVYKLFFVYFMEKYELVLIEYLFLFLLSRRNGL